MSVGGDKETGQLFTQISSLVSRSSAKPAETDATLISKFNALQSPLEKRLTVEIRKEVLNQLYKLDAMGALDSTYTLSLLQVLRRLAKEEHFWQEMNVKMYFDLYYQLTKWASHGLSKDHSLMRSASPESELKREVLLVWLSRPTSSKACSLSALEESLDLDSLKS